MSKLKAAKIHQQQQLLLHVEQNSQSQQTQLPSAKNKSTDPFKCTGKFKEDFENISKLKNIKFIPEVVLRGKIAWNNSDNAERSDQQTPQVEKVKTKESKKSSKVTSASTTHISSEVVTEKLPSTYSIKESYSYFKPKIGVEMDSPDKLDTVTEIHIKGWKIDKPFMDVFQITFPKVERLHTINLWNCGLDEENIKIFGSFISGCNKLKTLTIDGNPTPTSVYHVLFYNESSVQSLTLRNNQLDDDDITMIASGIGDTYRQNTKILHLNLCSNWFGDIGAIALAKALRTNRTLLTLNLANNKIEDNGAKALADVISRFELKHEEILHRRKVIAGRLFEKSASPVSRKGLDSRLDRPQSSQKSVTQSSIGDKKKSIKESISQAGSVTSGASKSTKDSKIKKDEKTKKNDTKATTKHHALKPRHKSAERLSAKEHEQINTELLEISPLTDYTDYKNEGLWLVGNRNLLVLNLSRNYLTEKSVVHFVLALQNQKSIIDSHKINTGPGLMRLVIQHNKFNYDNENYLKLLELLRTRDPFFKPVIRTDSASQSIIETSSVQSGRESSLTSKKPSSKRSNNH